MLLIFVCDDVNGSLNVTVIGSMMPSVPSIITTTTGMKVTFNGRSYNLSKGVNIIDDIVMVSGENVLTFTGTGTVTIEYNGGVL